VRVLSLISERLIEEFIIGLSSSRWSCFRCYVNVRSRTRRTQFFYGLLFRPANRLFGSAAFRFNLHLTVASENQFYLSFDMPLSEHVEQRVFVSTLLFLSSNHFYLHLIVGSENQFYLSFDKPLSEHVVECALRFTYFFVRFTHDSQKIWVCLRRNELPQNKKAALVLKLERLCCLLTFVSVIPLGLEIIILSLIIKYLYIIINIK
jgi:hypothetical protein